MSREKKMNSLWKEDCHCHYCGRPTWCMRLGMAGKPMEQATLDHIILYSQIRKGPKELKEELGGKWTRNNLVLACRRCNWARFTLPYEDFKRMVKPDAEMTEADWQAIEDLKKEKKKERGRWLAYWGRMKKCGVDENWP